ncbi:RNB-domain-containing protein [Lichtheimia hyalospora FSU 10163]|nr:RNB-domain-containing protein [Lichtheimia hyalospora FSU 10163]
MLRNGREVEFMSEDVLFRIPNFQQGDQPSSFEARMIFDYQKSIQLKKGLSLRGLNRIYKHFIAQADSKEHDLTVSLEDMARVAFGLKPEQPVTSEQLHITFLHLANDPLHYIPTNNVKVTQKWQLRSENGTLAISSIVDAIRSRDKSYTSFLERVRDLIQLYEQAADPVLDTVKNMKQFHQVQLTKQDARFINFVADWAKSPDSALKSPHDVYAPTILKALGCYKEDTFADKSLAMRFLKQVGMLKPWDNLFLFQNTSTVDEFLWSDRARESQQKLDGYARSFLEGQADRAGFYARDPCDSLRHDFGTLPVYTVDDPSAIEIDDGVSIERIPGSENACWLHIHIADPTAFIPPDHPMQQIMQQRVQTLYMPETHISMLPRSLGELKFSLGETAHTLRDGSQYAFSFSAKLDTRNGSILDWHVRPSVVRKVHKIYYDDLDTLLEPYVPTISDPHVHLDTSFVHPHDNNNAVQQTKTTTVPQEAEKDLIDIYKLIRTHQLARIRNGSLGFIRPAPLVMLDGSPIDLPMLNFKGKPHYATQVPTLRVALDRSAVSPARQMVAETMILGGRVVSQCAREHGLQIPHRTQTWRPEDDAELRQEMLDARDPETGMLPMHRMLNYMNLLPPAMATTTPGLPHVLMGITDGYVKATSPLRRYMDMIVHWQLKAHVLGTKAPFDGDTLTTLVPQLEAREKRLMAWQQGSIKCWVQQLIARLPSDTLWTCMVNRSNALARSDLGASMESASVTILELGVRARLANLDQTLQVGQVVKAHTIKNDIAQGYLDLQLV